MSPTSLIPESRGGGSSSCFRSNIGRLGTRNEFAVLVSMSVRYTEFRLSVLIPAMGSVRIARTSRKARAFASFHEPLSAGMDSWRVWLVRMIYCVVMLHWTHSLASRSGESRTVVVRSTCWSAPMYLRSAAKGSAFTYSRSITSTPCVESLDVEVAWTGYGSFTIPRRWRSSINSVNARSLLVSRCAACSSVSSPRTSAQRSCQILV